MNAIEKAMRPMGIGLPNLRCWTGMAGCEKSMGWPPGVIMRSMWAGPPPFSRSPAPRYPEATLVDELEALGSGWVMAAAGSCGVGVGATGSWLGWGELAPTRPPSYTFARGQKQPKPVLRTRIDSLTCLPARGKMAQSANSVSS